MKIRPVSSAITRRKRSLDSRTPIQIAKNDYRLLTSTAETAKYIDSQLFKVAETMPTEHLSIPSNEASDQLALLKLSNNSSQLSRYIINSRIRRLSLELSETKKAKVKGSKKLNSLYDKIDRLNAEILKIINKQNEFLNDQEIYFHIQNRLIATKVFLDMKKQYFLSQIKNKTIVLNEAERLRVKSYEGRSRNSKLCKNLHKTMSFFYKKNEEITDTLEKDKNFMNTLDFERENRQKRQIDIIESVGINEKNRTEKNLLNSLLIHKFWFMSLSKQLENYSKQFSSIDDAFKKIKSISGLPDMNSIVIKFLTKESTLQQLMSTIYKNKETVDTFSERNEKLAEKIEEITISEKNALGNNKISQLNSQILHKNLQNSAENKRFLQISSISSNVKN